MPTTFFVDVWSDVVCPYCYIGFHQLRDALSRFDHADEVLVRHHAFELDPHAADHFDGSLDVMLATKYSIPLEHAAALNQRVQESALAHGMEWSLSRARPTNSFDAHRLVAVAANLGRQEAMLERLFRAYFSEGLLLSDHHVLASLAREVGVDGADGVLASDHFADEVRYDEALAAKIGISGVPAFILDGRVHVSGARGSDVLLEELARAWGERRSTIP
jgi:predicted DsbA family dithiol-disulfide isomerase